MQQKYFYVIIWLCLLSIFPHSQAFAANRTEIRAYWAALPCSEETLWEDMPVTSAPYQTGTLTSSARHSASEYVNFMRWLSNLNPVRLSDYCAMYAQHGAVILASNDVAEHAPPCPEDMDDDFYQTAYDGARRCNIACLHSPSKNPMWDAVLSFAMDEGENNLELPHRRWLLNPNMLETDFGYAVSDSGQGYALMYAVDVSAAQTFSEAVCYPAQGAFPAEFLSPDTPWSISLPDNASDICVSLWEETSDAAWTLRDDGWQEDGYCVVSSAPYGTGTCLIFLPDLHKAGLEDYFQNQIWHVSVCGANFASEYAVEMISLTEIDVVSVEISPQTAQMYPHETLTLSACAVPAYADDVSVAWHSENPNVASVSECGIVTAVSEGTCRIIAESANGKQDVCIVTVHSAL